jgi:hypothetical protein
MGRFVGDWLVANKRWCVGDMKSILNYCALCTVHRATPRRRPGGPCTSDRRTNQQTILAANRTSFVGQQHGVARLGLIEVSIFEDAHCSFEYVLNFEMHCTVFSYRLSVSLAKYSLG